MSARNLLRLAIALVALLALWGAVTLGTRKGDVEERFRIPGTAAKDVDTVVFAGLHDTVVLARSGAGAWQANGHPADRRMMEDLLTSLADTAASGDLVAETPASYSSVGMDSASAKYVRVVAKGKTVADVIVGKAGQVYGTGYVRASSQPRVYLVRSALPTLASRTADEWRDRRIGGIPKDSIAWVEIERGAKRYTLGKQAGKWVLSPGRATDSIAVANFLRELGNIQATGFAAPAQVDSLKFTLPKRRLTVVGPDGRPKLRLVFDSTKSGLWAHADTGTTVWKLESWSADQITPAESTLAVRRKH
jgi:Domain of unknown function (DUF4340)